MIKIDRIFYDPDQTKVQLFYDKPQFDKSYLETEDFDGNEIIDHYESHNGATEADYVAVRFLLVTEEKKELDIYVNGKFANWELTNANKMEYVPEMGAYRLITDLKQGIYNYNYSTKNKITGQINERILDGSHAQTTNNYEIFITLDNPQAEPIYWLVTKNSKILDRLKNFEWPILIDSESSPFLCFVYHVTA